MRNLPLNSLRAFASVYESGGVRAAAGELGITHSSVSRHLAELERWMGVELTHTKATGRRRISLTPEGRALGRAALNSLRELAHAVASVREARSASSVQIGTHPSVATRWLLPRLPALEASLRGIEISVIVHRQLNQLEDSDLDLAIRIASPRRPDFRWQPLMGDELYPVMSPTFWERSGRPSQPCDLVGLRLLHDRDPQAFWGEWKRAFGPAKLDVRKGPRLTSTDLVLQAAANGQGVALARHQLAASDLASGALLRPLGDLTVVLENAYWVVLPVARFPKPSTLAVIDWLKREAAAAPESRHAGSG